MFLKAAFVYLVWSMHDPSRSSFFYSMVIGWYLHLMFGSKDKSEQ